MSKRQVGLTMIEVLAAMVIFSAGAVVLFGWIGQTADRLGRLNVEQRQLFADLLALEFLRTLNPMQQPIGEQALAGATMRWRAVPVGDETPARAAGGTEGIYAIQLYRADLQVETATGSRSDQVVYLAGWRQSRTAAAGGLFDPSAPGALPPNTPAVATPPPRP